MNFQCYFFGKLSDALNKLKYKYDQTIFAWSKQIKILNHWPKNRLSSHNFGSKLE